MGKTESGAMRLDGVRLTHADRVMFPQQGATKHAIAAYYMKAATAMLPYASRRPLTLVRCPQGQSEACFYQKHASPSVPDEIERFTLRERSGKAREYMLVANRRGLIAAAQIGALELHIWGSRSDRLERPERIVFDLDPDEHLSFIRVRKAAFELKEILETANLRSYALLTGSKGIHVVVPIRRSRSWEDVKAFAKGLATKLAVSAPENYVAKASKEIRVGRIYIDWLRNERGATAIAPYSLRARSGAPVAAPVNWSELNSLDVSTAFTLSNISERLVDAPSVWSDYFSVRQSISNAHLESVSDAERSTGSSA